MPENKKVKWMHPGIKAWTALLLSLFLLFGSVCQAAASPHVPGLANDTINILLVGNSYTEHNNLSETLQKICTSKGRKVKVTAVTKGGACLADFAAKNTAEGKKLRTLLRKQSWDYVVLQERHYYPLTNIADMKKAVCTLKPCIEKAGAQMALYMTWAPAKGHTDYKKYKSLVKNRAEYQKKIAQAYEYVADRTGALVIPVGIAFQNAQKQSSVPGLIQKDNYHPTKYGSYLAACTIYAALFDNSPAGASTGKLNKAKAGKLQRISWSTWREY